MAKNSLNTSPSNPGSQVNSRGLLGSLITPTRLMIPLLLTLACAPANAKAFAPNPSPERTPAVGEADEGEESVPENCFCPPSEFSVEEHNRLKSEEIKKRLTEGHEAVNKDTEGIEALSGRIKSGTNLSQDDKSRIIELSNKYAPDSVQELKKILEKEVLTAEDQTRLLGLYIEILECLRDYINYQGDLRNWLHSTSFDPKLLGVTRLYYQMEMALSRLIEHMNN
ncbi:hypothetical protein KKA95_01410 [Patescibacteria group bacterium]|nr:hypothetical protein [Patescibacteria group bacterium]